MSRTTWATRLGSVLTAVRAISSLSSSSIDAAGAGADSGIACGWPDRLTGTSSSSSAGGSRVALAVAGAVASNVLLWTALLFAYVVGLTAIAKAEAGSGLAGYWPAALLAGLLPRAIPTRRAERIFLSGPSRGPRSNQAAAPLIPRADHST